MTLKHPKAERLAPCGFKRVKKEDVFYPQVMCSLDCETCGWNPVESKRRWEEGEWKPLETRINAETSEVIKLKDVRQLVFRRREVESL